MNHFSKLTLSVDELQLVTNTEWILTKRKIIEKVDALLGDVAVQQQSIIEKEKDGLPTTVILSTPKIAKGENYLGLPYLLLDYPRCFNNEQIFAVRTMFWWGNFFSITLHLSGNHKEMFQQKIIENISAVKQDVFICINKNQWQHYFEPDNYVAVQSLEATQLPDVIAEQTFIKLAIKFPLQAWNDIPLLLDDAFTKLILLLKN